MDTVSRTAFAKILGITPNSVKIWESSRGFDAAYDGDKINVAKACKWLYQWKVELEEAESSANSNTDKDYWQAKKTEAQYKILVEELIPKGEYLAQERERILILKQAVMSIPDKLASELALSDPQKRLVAQTCKAVLETAKDTYKGRVKEWLEILNAKTLPMDAES